MVTADFRRLFHGLATVEVPLIIRGNFGGEFAGENSSEEQFIILRYVTNSGHERWRKQKMWQTIKGWKNQQVISVCESMNSGIRNISDGLLNFRPVLLKSGTISFRESSDR